MPALRTLTGRRKQCRNDRSADCCVGGDNRAAESCRPIGVGQANAVVAVNGMLTEHFLDYRLALFEKLIGVCRNDHTVRDLDGAGELFLILTFDIDHAQSACGLGL